VTSTDAPEHLEAYRLWLAQGLHGEMHYLERHLPLKADPTQILPEARSILVVACNYFLPDSELQPAYRVARYARGDDYHGFMKKMLEQLAEALKLQAPELIYRAFVDSGPLMERDLATRAGLGWIGKNTCLIHPQQGSWLLLGCLLTNLELAPDRPFEAFHCGSCTRCLEACPTQALTAPHVLDARRCIAYWTIEQRESMEPSLRSQVGDWLFGCDICQDVCPWNQRFAQASEIAAFAPREWLQSMPLQELILLSPRDFELKIAPRSPLKRPKYRGFIRNVAVVIGNSQDLSYLPALLQAQQQHAADPMLLEHISWAIQQVRA